MEDWAERWAKDFHDTYERSARQFGYETRKESAKPWAEVPANNRNLMIAVCAEVLCRFMAWRESVETANSMCPLCRRNAFHSLTEHEEFTRAHPAKETK